MIEVAEGYARNFLLPKNLAVLATADAMNTMKLQAKAKAKADAEAKAAAQELAGKLKGCQVKIAAKGGAGGKLQHDGAVFSSGNAEINVIEIFINDIVPLHSGFIYVFVPVYFRHGGVPPNRRSPLGSGLAAGKIPIPRFHFCFPCF